LLSDQESSETLTQVLRRTAREPGAVLVQRWNWKAALWSGSIRGAVFLAATLKAGWGAALGAMGAEFLLRVVTAGFYGSMTQALSRVQPHWHGTAAALVVLPLLAHVVEYGIHRLRGTPHLGRAMVASVGFTLVATLFHLYVMRRGAWLAGAEARPLAEDLRRTPALLAGFLLAVPRKLVQTILGKNVLQ
jgi:hypothetical protein